MVHHVGGMAIFAGGRLSMNHSTPYVGIILSPLAGSHRRNQCCRSGLVDCSLVTKVGGMNLIIHLPPSLSLRNVSCDDRDSWSSISQQQIFQQSVCQKCVIVCICSCYCCLIVHKCNEKNPYLLLLVSRWLMMVSVMMANIDHPSDERQPCE